MKKLPIALLLVLLAFWISPVSAVDAAIRISGQTSAQGSNVTPAQSSQLSTSDTAVQNAGLPTTQGPTQPIPFNHKQHAGKLKMSCQYCHTTSRSGDAVAIPHATMCMQCHQTIDAGSPAIQKLATYANSNAPIPWVRIYELPSFVSFSHRTHLLHGATCQECHGAVADRVQLYKETDISMATCVNCHSAKKANTSCNTCHTLDQ